MTLPLKRGRGRPRADEPHLRVSTWIPQAEFDRLNRLAQQCDLSISSVLRASASAFGRVVVLRLPKEDA